MTFSGLYLYTDRDAVQGAVQVGHSLVKKLSDTLLGEKARPQLKRRPSVQSYQRRPSLSGNRPLTKDDITGPMTPSEPKDDTHHSWESMIDLIHERSQKMTPLQKPSLPKEDACRALKPRTHAVPRTDFEVLAPGVDRFKGFAKPGGEKSKTTNLAPQEDYRSHSDAQEDDSCLLSKNSSFMSQDLTELQRKPCIKRQLSQDKTPQRTTEQSLRAATPVGGRSGVSHRHMLANVSRAEQIYGPNHRRLASDDPIAPARAHKPQLKPRSTPVRENPPQSGPPVPKGELWYSEQQPGPTTVSSLTEDILVPRVPQRSETSKTMPPVSSSIVTASATLVDPSAPRTWKPPRGPRGPAYSPKAVYAVPSSQPVETQAAPQLRTRTAPAESFGTRTSSSSPLPVPRSTHVRTRDVQRSPSPLSMLRTHSQSSRPPALPPKDMPPSSTPKPAIFNPFASRQPTSSVYSTSSQPAAQAVSAERVIVVQNGEYRKSHHATQVVYETKDFWVEQVDVPPMPKPYRVPRESDSQSPSPSRSKGIGARLEMSHGRKTKGETRRTHRRDSKHGCNL